MAFGIFDLSIRLGNAAMGDADDVAQALDEVASRLRAGCKDGKVRDANGNSVGQFDLDLEEEESDDDDGQDALEESE